MFEYCLKFFNGFSMHLEQNSLTMTYLSCIYLVQPNSHPESYLKGSLKSVALAFETMQKRKANWKERRMMLSTNY